MQWSMIVHELVDHIVESKMIAIQVTICFGFASGIYTYVEMHCVAKVNIYICVKRIVIIPMSSHANLVNV